MRYCSFLVLFLFLNLNSFSQNKTRCYNGVYFSANKTIDFSAEFKVVQSKLYTHRILFSYYVRGVTDEERSQFFYCKQVDSVFYFSRDSTYFNFRKKQAHFVEDSNLLITDVSFFAYRSDSAKVLMEDFTNLAKCNDNQIIEVIGVIEDLRWEYATIDSVEEVIDYCCEFEPSFPRGNDALNYFIRTNLNYSSEYSEINIQGTVYVQFIVEVDGTLTQPIILKGIDPLLDKEALRIVQIMPAWIPGGNTGRPVRFRYIIPIRFSR